MSDRRVRRRVAETSPRTRDKRYDRQAMRTGWPANVASLLFVASCSFGDNLVLLPDHGPLPELTGELLAFDMTTVAENAAALPPGFTMPRETVCAADVTRGFISEIVDHGFDGAQVSYEWAPVAAGPAAMIPTIGQPEFIASGTVTGLERSGLDFRPSHPFGFDTTWDFRVDAAFRDLVHNRPGDSNDGDGIHAEIESGLFPDTLFGLTPMPGDRVAMKGAWILDCGHPPYEAEIHPPTFAAFARIVGDDTVALAFANPYRSSQLYGAVDEVVRFSEDTRFSSADSGPFTRALTLEVIQAALGEIRQFALHILVEATRFDPLTWFVCAPPRPSPAARLSFSYRYVARSGVTISAATRDDSGCLEFHAEMATGYKPATPIRKDRPWTWMEINSEASSQAGTAVDVRQLIVDALDGQGLPSDVPALQADTPTLVDQYAALAPRAGVSDDNPVAIVRSADDQPFPFYGRVRIGWR